MDPVAQGSGGNRGGSSSGSYSKSGYKTRMVDRSKFKCYNCNEPEILQQNVEA